MRVSTMRRRIAIVTLGSPEHGWSTSGAEVIASSVCKGLAARHDVTVLHGAAPNGRDSGRGGPSLALFRSIAAFPLTKEVADRGIVNCEALLADAKKALEHADIVLQFERVLERCFSGVSVGVLGSVVYPHCREIAESREWDVLVVPSEFVRAAIRQRWGGCSRDVRVIENGIDLRMFKPRRQGPLDSETAGDTRKLKFILPGRPEWGKGYLEARALMEVFEKEGTAPELHCFRYDGFLGAGTFYRDLEAKFAGLKLLVHPWQPRSQLPKYYHACAATLCLGNTPEGFGLTAVESLACGVPVLCNPIGHLGSVVPPGAGLCSVGEFRRRGSLSGSLVQVLKNLEQECENSGVPYVRKRYSEERMIEGYQSILETFL